MKYYFKRQRIVQYIAMHIKFLLTATMYGCEQKSTRLGLSWLRNLKCIRWVFFPTILQLNFTNWVVNWDGKCRIFTQNIHFVNFRRKKIVLFNREKKRKWKHYRIFVSILFLVIKISRIFCCCCCFGSIRFGVVNDQADERDRKNQRAQQTIDRILEINRLKYSIDFWLLYILIFLPSGFSVLVIFAVSHNFFYIWLEISQPWP